MNFRFFNFNIGLGFSLYFSFLLEIVLEIVLEIELEIELEMELKERPFELIDTIYLRAASNRNIDTDDIDDESLT